MKKVEICIKILTKEALTIQGYRQKHKSKSAHAARSYNFECDSLISTTSLNVIGLLNCPITICPITKYPITNCPITTWLAN